MKVKWGERVGGKRLGPGSALGRRRVYGWRVGMTQVKNRESDGEEEGGCRAGKASIGIWTWSVYCATLSAEGHTKSLTNNTTYRSALLLLRSYVCLERECVCVCVCE